VPGNDLVAVRLFPLEQIRITDDGLSGRRAIGRFASQSYDPFNLYYTSVERRGEPKPPHLEFASLSGDDDAALSFLRTFGPLTSMENSVPESSGDELNLAWRDSVRDSKERFRSPEEYYRQHMLLHPLTVSSGFHKRSPSTEGVTVDLSTFWAEQEEFLAVLELVRAIRPRKMPGSVRHLLRLVISNPPAPTTGIGRFTPELYGDFQVALHVQTPENFSEEGLKAVLQAAIGMRSDQQIVDAAARFVELRVNTRLLGASPCIVAREGLERTWRCKDLISALYMMLFLDLDHNRRLVRCPGCGAFFQDAKQNVVFCSSRCETRMRVRKWWRRNGKKYRSKKLKTKRRRMGK
jgi:hypothetical protein